MPRGPESPFQARLRTALADRGCEVTKTHGNQYIRGISDLSIELNDKFRWVELKAYAPQPHWLITTQVPVVGDLSGDQWTFLQRRAVINQRPRAVAGLVVTAVRFATNRELYFTVLAGSKAFVRREYSVPWGLAQGLPAGNSVVWPEEGLCLVSYECSLGRHKIQHRLPVWPLTDPWWCADFVAGSHVTIARAKT